MAVSTDDLHKYIKHHKYATFAIVAFLVVLTLSVLSLSNNLLSQNQSSSSQAAASCKGKGRTCQRGGCAPGYSEDNSRVCNGKEDVCCKPEEPTTKPCIGTDCTVSSPTPTSGPGYCIYSLSTDCNAACTGGSCQFCPNNNRYKCVPKVDPGYCIYSQQNECSAACTGGSCQFCPNNSKYKCVPNVLTPTPPKDQICSTAGKPCTNTSQCGESAGGKVCARYECDTTYTNTCTILGPKAGCSFNRCDGNKCIVADYNPDPKRGGCYRSDKCGNDPKSPDLECGGSCPNGFEVYKYDFQAAGYKPGEKVSTWVGFENGTAVATQQVYADSLGGVSYTVSSQQNWENGAIRLVAHGLSSEHEEFRDYNYYKKCK